MAAKWCKGQGSERMHLWNLVVRGCRRVDGTMGRVIRAQSDMILGYTWVFLLCDEVYTYVVEMKLID